MARRAKGEGTLRKRKDGRWEGWFNIGKDETGKTKRISVTAKTKTECQEKLKQAQAKYEEEQKILSSHNYLTESDPTLERWYEIWLNTFCKGVIKEYTVHGYASRFELYILPEFGKMKLSEISTVACQQFLVDLLNNGRIRSRDTKGGALSIYTVKGVQRTLNVCLEKAVDEGLIVKNPCSKVKLPITNKPEMKTLKKEELSAFLEETKRSGCYEFYYLELTTGMRLGEICALEWTDLDTVNKTISVNKSVRKLDGKLIITTPKTKSSIRTIRIADELVDLLLAMKERQIESTYIFPSPDTGGPRDTSAVTRKLHRIQERAGLPKIRFHDLRHTFATLTLEAGVDVKTVSHMLGHTDAGFTMNTYMHVTDDIQKNAADKMKNLIENSGKNTKKIKFPA
ncbi:MAG: site-specific integrase [Eubacterium sp.]|nr:site-specific integrase [Eubacterium sp.]